MKIKYNLGMEEGGGGLKGRLDRFFHPAKYARRQELHQEIAAETAAVEQKRLHEGQYIDSFKQQTNALEKRYRPAGKIIWGTHGLPLLNRDVVEDRIYIDEGGKFRAVAYCREAVHTGQISVENAVLHFEEEELKSVDVGSMTMEYTLDIDGDGRVSRFGHFGSDETDGSLVKRVSDNVETGQGEKPSWLTDDEFVIYQTDERPELARFYWKTGAASKPIQYGGFEINDFDGGCFNKADGSIRFRWGKNYGYYVDINKEGMISEVGNESKHGSSIFVKQEMSSTHTN